MDRISELIEEMGIRVSTAEELREAAQVSDEDSEVILYE